MGIGDDNMAKKIKVVLPKEEYGTIVDEITKSRQEIKYLSERIAETDSIQKGVIMGILISVAKRLEKVEKILEN